MSAKTGQKPLGGEGRRQTFLTLLYHLNQIHLIMKNSILSRIVKISESQTIKFETWYQKSIIKNGMIILNATPFQPSMELPLESYFLRFPRLTDALDAIKVTNGNMISFTHHIDDESEFTLEFESEVEL